MSTHEIKLSIHHLLEDTDDPEVLAIVYALLKKLTLSEADDIAGYEADGSPISAEALINSVLESSREAKAGQIISHAEMKAMLGIHG